MKIAFQIFLGFLMLTNSLHANDLRQKLDLDSLYNVAFSYVGVDINKAQFEANQYLHQALSQGDSINIAYAFDIKGLATYYADDIDSAFYYSNLSIKLFRKLSTDSFGLSTAIYNRSIYDEYLGAYQTALRGIHLSREIDIKRGDKLGSDIFYFYRLSDIVFNQGNTELALRYLHKAWRALKMEGYSNYMIPAILSDFAWTYLELGLDEEAYRYALMTYREGVKNKDIAIRSNALLVFSELELKKGNYASARSFADKALEYDIEYGDQHSIIYTKAYLAKVMAKEGRIKEADALFTEVSSEFMVIPDPILRIEVANKLYDFYKEQNRMAEALKYLEVVSKEEKRVNSIDGQAAMKQFDEELANRKQELIKAKSQLQEEELKIKSTLLALALVLLGITLLASVLIFRTNKKLSEAKSSLEERNTEIKQKADLLSKTSEELQQQNTALDKMNKSKDRLFSILTHDLRQPFNQIMSVVDLMEQDVLEADEKKTLIQELRNSVSSTSALVSNVLLWSKAQFAGVTLKTETIPLLNALKRSLLHFSMALEKKKITLELNIPDHLTIFFDVDHFASVCRNILSNAYKFSPKGSTIFIWAEEQKDYVLLHFKDEGAGMDQYQVDQLMEAKNKVSMPGTLNENGTGIGMIIIRDFVVENNASYFIHSELGKGTVFSLKLPKGESLKDSKTLGKKALKA